MPKSKFAQRDKVKKKSIKSKAKLSAKRKLSRFGKVQKEGHAGNATTYVTRTKAIKKLQLSLKDFRRLCILKGIYPREPKNKSKAKNNTFYHFKDIQYLAHEPLLAKFRETKAFMKKVKRAAGRKEFAEAQRLYSHRPEYTLDHLVKERYPTFADALADLDDAVSMVHLFATLPSEKHIDPAHTALSKRLCREWQAYVAKSKGLRKVFLSIKGVYFQAEVNGHTVTWLQPWQFTPNLPRIVDFKVMATFLQFYEVLLKFVLHKLYHQMGLSYPPVLLEDVEAHGGNLAALQLKAVTGDGGAASSKDAPKLSTAAAKAQLASVQKAVAAAVAHAGNVDETLVSESEQSDSENDVGDGYDETSAEAIAAQKAKRALQRLFKGKTFFLSREVPRDLFEFIIQSFGGKVGWDGVGSTLRSDSPTITHHVIDRPTVVDAVKGREYVQPQWVVDSINTCMLLPIAKYAPGVDLPPHLSPFVDDVAKGYIPQYREQLDKLRAAATVTGIRAPDASKLALEDVEQGDGSEELFEDDSEEDSDEGDSDSSDDSSDDDASDQEEAAAQPKARQAPRQQSPQEAMTKPQAATAAVVKKRKALDMEVQNEHRKMAESMLSNKKAKQYKVVMNARSKAADEVSKLGERRDALAGKSASPKATKGDAVKKQRK